jgi:tetratricopeptide (TPR) repeat protein
MEAFIFIIWIGLAILVGVLAKDKKIGGGGGFLIALIFSPLIGLLAAIVSPQREKIDPRSLATSPEAQRLFAHGESATRKRNYDEAIARFESVLQIQPFAPATNYYLAKLYSIKQNKTKAFKHLTVAINQGFADFADMTSSPALTFLRNQPEFRDYAERGYKMLPDSTAVQTATIARVSAPAPPIGTTQPKTPMLYIFVDQEVKGPFTRSQIEALLRMQTVNYATPCCEEGANDWKTVADVVVAEFRPAPQPGGP